MDNQEKDKWQLALDEPLDLLLNCQSEHNIDSCLKCKEILNCKTRDSYVKSVYESMNKGVNEGGFEFN
jgi:hypothetical protein